MPTRPWFLVSILAILLVALFLRLDQISSENMGGDEMFSVHTALGDTSLGHDLDRNDMQPPMFHLLLHWALPGPHPTSELQLRWLSVTFGAALILLVVSMGFWVPQLRYPALLAGLLLAVNQTHIFYSQEVRPYALYCFVVGALVLWALLLDRYGHAWSYWVVGTAVMTAVFYAHFLGGFFCAAVILPMVLGKNPLRVRLKAVAASGLAFALLLPCLWQKKEIFHGNNLSSEGISHGVASWFTLKMLLAQYMGIPDFGGATTVAFLAGAVLIACAFLPRFRTEKDVLSFQSRVTLALAALLPPVTAFFLARPPLNFSIFSERHVLPAIVSALLLVSYGLWRLAARAPKPAAAFLLGAVILAAFQFQPVWHRWPGPARQPRAIFAEWLRTHPDYPVYTTWPWNIGEPVMYYLGETRPIYMLPGTPPEAIDNKFYYDAVLSAYRLPPAPAGLPDKFVVLYRPAASYENASVQSLLDRFEMTGTKQCYSARNSTWGACLVVMQRRDTAAASQAAAAPAAWMSKNGR